MKNDSYAPRWVLNVVCAAIAQRFVEGNLPLEAYANQMATELEKHYSDCSPEKLSSAAEAMLFFLAEIEDDNAITYCKSFIYNSALFDFANYPRKLKGMFFDPLAPRREMTTSKSIVYGFRAFVFRLRSDSQLAAPSEWMLANVDELKVLNDIISVEVIFFDAI
ncbi:hypothetical protein [Planktotalea sp.]|uniref:hypothetical protein n=1 Tax=Planktotalea sp. TaxID=2029877 RepID=UPI003F6CC80B